MTYRFKVSEPIAKGVSRIGLEQIDTARTRLARRNDVASAIHDARRCLKRVRALLRLVRPALAETIYRREANRFSGIGRLLADARDQHVMQLTLTKLESRFPDLPKRIGVQLAKLLANGTGAKPAPTDTASRRQAQKDLEQARTFFVRAEHRDIEFEHLFAGLERSYRRARRAFREAYNNPTDEAFHDWRKSVQQHWRHMQLLSRGWPEVLGGRASEAKEVSRLLGEDHDLSVLLTLATGRGKHVLAVGDLATLEAKCRSLQAELRELAKPRGARLFAEPAEELTERISRYWLAARDLNELAPPGENGSRKAMKKPAHGDSSKRAPRAAGQAASRGSSGPGSNRPGR